MDDRTGQNKNIIRTKNIFILRYIRIKLRTPKNDYFGE
jgi:hypothetical protein